MAIQAHQAFRWHYSCFPYSKLQINQVGKVQRTAAHWTCRRWQNTSVGKMLDELEWPSLEARRDRSSLLLFHLIHSGAVSIERQVPDPWSQFEIYQGITQCPILLIPDIQWCPEELIFSRTIPQWNGLAPSVVNSQTTEELRALLIKSEKNSRKVFLVFFLKKFQILSPWPNDRMRSCQ